MPPRRGLVSGLERGNGKRNVGVLVGWLHHCWLTNKTKATTAIKKASRIPTTNEITGCRLRVTSSDPAPFCAAPRPNQKRSLSIERYLALQGSHLASITYQGTSCIV